MSPGTGELDQLRATLAALPACHGLGIAHAGAIHFPAGSVPTVIVDGWDQAGVSLAEADAPVPLEVAAPLHRRA